VDGESLKLRSWMPGDWTKKKVPMGWELALHRNVGRDGAGRVTLDQEVRHRPRLTGKAGQLGRGSRATHAEERS
jgi:hypothetical protein